jgi:DNA-binding NarL/FixJ family response regulator
MIKIGIAEDFELIRKGFANLIKEMGIVVVVDAANGKELIHQLNTKSVDIVLMDISMPEMDGVKTTLWLLKNKPNIRVIALSISDDEYSVLRMVRAGARGYLLKSASPDDLKRAIMEVHEKGFYFSDLVSSKLIRSMNGNNLEEPSLLTEREIGFLKLASTDMTYREIGQKLNVSTRTVESWAALICEKLNVKSRISLVLFAIKNRIISI